MNAIAANALTHTCPKCFGVGTMPHKHIQNGVCFLCNGDKRVTRATASRWLAAQSGFVGAVDAKPAGPKAPPRPFKSVALGAFGTVRISRTDDGGFVASDLQTGEGCGYFVFFTVTAGRVKVDTTHLQYGMTNHWRAAEKALQAALKA
jgi:hypothetical protein